MELYSYYTQTSKRNSKEIMYELWKNFTEQSKRGIYLYFIYYTTNSLLLVRKLGFGLEKVLVKALLEMD